MYYPLINAAISVTNAVIPAMSDASIAKVRRLTEMTLRHLPQIPFKTEHRLHAGIYTRTVTIPAPPLGGQSTVCTGVLVKIPTQLIICGDVIVYMGEGEKPVRVSGQRVFLGSPGRKQAFLSNGEYTMTMCFATDAKTVAEAEAQFTDEVDLLCPLSDTERHDIIVTGE
jgi:hypothetical protein